MRFQSCICPALDAAVFDARLVAAVRALSAEDRAFFLHEFIVLADPTKARWDELAETEAPEHCAERFAEILSGLLEELLPEECARQNEAFMGLLDKEAAWDALVESPESQRFLAELTARSAAQIARGEFSSFYDVLDQDEDAR